MQAVITAGGKQYIVEPNQTLDIDLLPAETNSDSTKLSFEPLMVIDGDKITVGTPVVKNVTVSAEVIGRAKGEKIKVLKFKAKKRVSKLTGHRQHYSSIKITAIGAAKADSKPAATKAEAKPKVKTVAKTPTKAAK
jgi:large subunit ribosomal protein L21